MADQIKPLELLLLNFQDKAEAIVQCLPVDSVHQVELQAPEIGLQCCTPAHTHSKRIKALYGFKREITFQFSIEYFWTVALEKQ